MVGHLQEWWRLSTTSSGRVLLASFTLAFASSFGQTHFIGVFGPSLQAEFQIGRIEWTVIYMVGTLLSAALLMWTGTLMDRIALRTYALMVVAALILATGLVALVSTVAGLVVAIFFLRHAGQGLASHVGPVAVARHFSKNRGKAVAFVCCGFSVGEAFLPFLAVLAIAAYGWRATYGGIAVILILLLIPLIAWLLRDQRQVAGDPVARTSDPIAAPAAASIRAWTLRQVLGSTQFYLTLPAVTAPSMIVTALFFHQLEVADSKAWQASWITANYWVFAAGTVVAMFSSGQFIDRYSARRVLPIFLVPMGLGLIIVWQLANPLWAIPYLLFLGITSGIGYTAITSLLTEIYGPTNLGSIRALVETLSVFFSAIGPLIMALLMSAGLSVETICAVASLYVGLATIMLMRGLRLRQHS